MDFTPDGKGLVCGSTDGVLKYWDVSSLEDPVEIRGFRCEFLWIFFSLFLNMHIALPSFCCVISWT